MAGKFLLGNSETMGHRGYLANRLGVFLTNVRVQILMVSKPGLPSQEAGFSVLNLLGRKGIGKLKVLSESCFLLNSLKSYPKRQLNGCKILVLFMFKLQLFFAFLSQRNFGRKYPKEYIVILC